MSLQENGSVIPITIANQRLLEVCFDRISEQGATLEYGFDELDVEEWSEGAYSSVDEEPNFPWRHFFIENENGNWVFDTDALVEGWCATLQEKHGIPTLEIEQVGDGNGSQYNVKVDGKKRGIVKFALHFNSEELLKDDVNPRESQFLIGFDIPQSGIDREAVFPWTAVSDDDFWQTISEILIELQGPPTEELYAANSYVADNMPGGPKRTLEAVTKVDQDLKFRGEPKFVDNVKNAGNEIDVSSLKSAAEINDTTHLVLCKCTDSNTEELHLHLIENGEAKQVDVDSDAANISNIIKNKVNKYNDLKDDRHNTGRFVKLTLGLLTVGALPAVNAVLGIATDGEFQLEPVALIILNAVFLAFVLGFFLITIQPMFELWHFNWDQPKAYENARSRIYSVMRDIFQGSNVVYWILL